MKSAPTSSPTAVFMIFSQERSPQFPISECRVRAERFFDAKVGFREEVRAEEVVVSETRPVVERAMIVLEKGRSPHTCLVRARRATIADHELLDRDTVATQNGVSALGKRCGVVYVITDGEWRSALLLSAIFASVVLGPIVDLGTGEVFGVKTAREKLGN